MRSDLRNLAGVQETFWNDGNVYYGGAIPEPGSDPVPAVATG